MWESVRGAKSQARHPTHIVCPRFFATEFILQTDASEGGGVVTSSMGVNPIFQVTIGFMVLPAGQGQVPHPSIVPECFTINQLWNDRCTCTVLHLKKWAVGSLVVRASDSRPEGLGSMPVPPNTLRVHTEYVLVKSVDQKVLWAKSRVQGTGENFNPLQFHV
ncbi:uncharacterized protein TNCV_2633761 [Trichonephila clavipes]|nr:uncharacterized protein TNCV_2633761 [Trichonephila clavipes]